MPPVSPIRRAGAAVSPYRRARPAESNFEDLLRPQVEYLYRLAWRFTGSVADAEDLVQDVLTKLFPRTQELLEIERLRPWLARVLYNQYVDSVRQRSRSPIVELVAGVEGEENPLDALPTAKDGPEANAERTGQRERILRALDRLNPEQRAVVAMHDVEGYSLEELETMLETPLGTLKSRLHRARQRLRALLPMEPFSVGERVKG
ncbi:MAG: RNA polymerase sigma factor [Betaproteobacteria bacterium]|nr:MAG: RNA polymerase sigma factor [Betaproteobacteria bacterium]TMH92950.1 MAG: RNA polymerase sigma factor [Betaproteobacteria bacterium]